MGYLKVSDNSNLYRDSLSGAIINSNSNEYNNYIQQKTIKEQENKRIDTIQNEIKDLKNDIGEIKSLLRSLINGN